MFFINVFIILMITMLAILSRQHYSKYKNKGTKIWLAMGETIYRFLSDKLRLEKYKSLLRKINVTSPEKIDKIFEQSSIKIITFCIVLITIFNIYATSQYIVNSGYKSIEAQDYKIPREEYDGSVKSQSIYIQMGNDIEEFVVDISPRRLSENEFFLRAEDTFQEIDNTFSNLGMVSTDVDLPTHDSRDVFSISWESDNPQIISSSGRVKLPLPDETKVKMTATVEYFEYCAKREFYLVVGNNLNDKEKRREDIENTLKILDTSNPCEEYVEIPRRIMGYKASVQKDKDSSIKIMGLGFLCCIGFVVLKIGALKDKVKERDKNLIKAYPLFVNKLWLYLGTGMTVKAAFKHLIQDYSKVKVVSMDNILIKELEYTMNQIDTGFDEASAYEACGQRLNLSIYKEFMRLISQNIKMGTKDLRILMEVQVEKAFENRTENAKKQGEEASTKLVFPMVVLLAVVMVIIMVPALMGM